MPSVATDWLRYLRKIALLKKYGSDGKYAKGDEVVITDAELADCKKSQKKEGIRVKMFDEMSPAGFGRWVAETHAERVDAKCAHNPKDGIAVMSGAGLSASGNVPTFRGESKRSFNSPRTLWNTHYELQTAPTRRDRNKRNTKHVKWSENKAKLLMQAPPTDPRCQLDESTKTKVML